MKKMLEFTKQELLKSGQFTTVEKLFLEATIQEGEKISLQKTKEKLQEEKKRKVV